MKRSIVHQLSSILQQLMLGLALLVVIQTLSYGQVAAPQRPQSTTPVITAADGLPVDSLTFDFNRDIAVQLIPFEEMYKIALANSPAIRIEGALATAQQASLQLAKFQILQNVGGYANYSTGNQAILSTGPTSTGNDQLGQISNGYRAGVNFGISVYDLFGRPQQLRLAKANVEALKERRRTAEIQLKRELFNLYQDLILSQRVLKIRIRDAQISLAAYQVAEIEWQTGKIPPETHAANSNHQAEITASVEQAKTQFIKDIYALELAVGVPIHQLKRN